MAARSVDVLLLIIETATDKYDSVVRYGGCHRLDRTVGVGEWLRELQWLNHGKWISVKVELGIKGGEEQ